MADNIENKKEKKHTIIPALAAAAGIGGVTFALTRKPWIKSNVLFVERTKKYPGILERAARYIESGMPHVYVNKHGKPFKHQGKIRKGDIHTLLGTPANTEKVPAKHKPIWNAFWRSGGQKESLRMADKYREAKLIKNVKTIKVKPGTTHKELKQILGKRYIIKDRYGMASNGLGMRTEKDIKARGKYKRDVLHGTDKKTKYIAQKRFRQGYHPIDSSPLEIRVKTLHGKILPGSASRWSLLPAGERNVEKAHKQVRKALRQMGKTRSKNLYGFDVAITRKGKAKIVESNPQEFYPGSGYMGLAQTAYPLYKKITGKAAMPEAMGKALLAGGAGGLGTTYLTDRSKKNEKHAMSEHDQQDFRDSLLLGGAGAGAILYGHSKGYRSLPLFPDRDIESDVEKGHKTKKILPVKTYDKFIKRQNKIKMLKQVKKEKARAARRAVKNAKLTVMDIAQSIQKRLAKINRIGPIGL